MNRTKELEEKIRHHRDLYYKGSPEISDDVFDTLVQELEKIASDSLVLKEVGSPAEFAKSKH